MPQEWIARPHALVRLALEIGIASQLRTEKRPDLDLVSRSCSALTGAIRIAYSSQSTDESGDGSS